MITQFFIRILSKCWAVQQCCIPLTARQSRRWVGKESLSSLCGCQGVFCFDFLNTQIAELHKCIVYLYIWAFVIKPILNSLLATICLKSTYIYIFIFSNFGSRDILKCQCLVGLFLSVITSVARQGPELLLCVQCTGARTCNTLLMVASLTLGRFCL